MTDRMKKSIRNFLLREGAGMVGFASPDTWDARDDVAVENRPRSLWPPVRTVITFGVQMPLPIVETTPSVQHRDLYNTCNRILDDLAFRLVLWLSRRGHAAIPFSRDGYARVDVLLKKPGAAFAHTYAAQYGGLGHAGLNNTILTKEFGPRVRFTSVFTSLEITADDPFVENLCIRCGACVDLCPVQALTLSRKDMRDKSVTLARYNGRRCALWAKALTAEGCYPCGICIKVCPVGRDRVLYGREKTAAHYRKELSALAAGTDDPLYRAWTVIRRYGSTVTDGGDTPEEGLKIFFEKTSKNIKEDEHEQ